MGPSNIIINILTSIKEFQRNTFFAGVPQGGGGQNLVFSLLIEIRPPHINVNISKLIKEIQQKYFLCQGCPKGGSNFFLSLLLEIRPSNMNINISILIKDIKKKCQGRTMGEGHYIDY